MKMNNINLFVIYVLSVKAPAFPQDKSVSSSIFKLHGCASPEESTAGANGGRRIVSGVDVEKCEKDLARRDSDN